MGGYQRRLSAAQQDENIKAALSNENLTRQRVEILEKRAKRVEGDNADRMAREQFYKAAGWRGFWRRLVWVVRGDKR